MAANNLTILVPVAGGRLAPTDEQRRVIAAFLAKRDGKAVEVRLAKPTSNRSLRANRYYWGAVLTTIAEATGNSTEDLHVAFREMFLPRRFIQLGAKEVEVRKTTHDLSTAEFQQYLGAVTAWAASELGITVPDQT